MGDILKERDDSLIRFKVDHYIVKKCDSGLIGLERFGFREIKRDDLFFYSVELFHDFLKVISCDSNILPVSHPLILSNDTVFIEIHFSHKYVIRGLTVTGEVILYSLPIDDFFIIGCNFMEYFECFLESFLFDLFYEYFLLMIDFESNFPFFV